MKQPFWQMPGAEPKPIDIVGHVFGMHDNTMVWFKIGLSDIFLPLFSTVGKLHGFMAMQRLAIDRIKQITDPAAFIASVPVYLGDQRLHIIVDPYLTERGTTRYREIQR
jgi:hypothetical protein